MIPSRSTALLVRLAALCGLVISAGVSHNVRAQALPNVDSCIKRLDPDVDIGYDRIAARCPDLARQLEQGAWSAWLPRGWKEGGNDLSAASLRELRELASRETAVTPSERTPDVRRLKVVLAGFGVAGVRTESWWSHFKAWLRSVLESREQQPRDSWFSRMVSRVGFSQSVIELASYAALAAVVALAGLIVANELRAAGLLSKTGFAGRRRRAARSEARAAVGGWSDLETAAFGDKPRLLLQLIVARLGERGFLPPSGAMTVRELTRAARLSAPDDRARLADLGLATERVRFSDREIPSAGLEAPLARGRELLESLDASAPR
jgi:Domain of unknown function (DUF4129)